jgi:hypothetical protein
MNAPTIVLRIRSSRVKRHGRSPLALLATLSLALVLGFMAVVLLQGGQLKGNSSGPPHNAQPALSGSPSTTGQFAPTRPGS